MFVSVSAREQAVRYRRAAISLFLEQVKPRLTTTSRAILFQKKTLFAKIANSFLKALSNGTGFLNV